MRAGKTIFLLEGMGEFNGTYREYAEGSYPPHDIAQTGTLVSLEELRAQELAGEIVILAGKLP